MVFRKKKYAKKSYGRFGKRRLRKSKYGRFGRAVRAANRKFGRSKILVPRNQIAPKNCFIKVRQVTRLNYSSVADAVYFEQLVRANGLHDTCIGTGSDFSDKKLFYYGRMYDRYYVYASKIKATITPAYNATATIAQFPVVYAIVPNLSVVEIGSLVDYNASAGKPSIELQPHARYRYHSGPVYGMNAGKVVLKHKMSTKKMMGKNTKTDNDYVGDITATSDTGIVMDNPLNQWFWHVIAYRPDLNHGGTYTAGQILCEVMLDIEWSVMLTTNYNTAAVIANDAT